MTRIAHLVVGSWVLCGCPYSQAKLPDRVPPAAPPRAMTEWWRDTEVSCPSVDIGSQGKSPGAGIVAGVVREVAVPRSIHCEAAGQPHGLATEWDGNGGASTGQYDRGLRQGEWVSYGADGRAAAVGEFRDSRAEGAWTFFDPEGAVSAAGMFRAGRKDGHWTYFDRSESGQIRPSRFEIFENDRVTKHGGYIDDEPIVTRLVCVVGSAWPYCRSVLSLDIAARAPFARTGSDPPGSTTGSLEAGLLINLDRHHGVGGSIGTLFSDPVGDAVIRGRYRFWPISWLALEAAPSLYVADGSGFGGGLALTASVTDMVGVGIEIEHYPSHGVEMVGSVKVSLVALGYLAGAALYVGAAMLQAAK